jgi:MYXO-CTERM domain-containing protein
VGLSWPVASLLVPAARRPELDSPTDSLLDVIVSQNGVGRFAYAASTGATNAVRGAPGPLRLVTEPFAGQIGWFLPVAVLAGLLAVVRLRRGAALSPVWLVLGGWFVLGCAVLSVMGGPLHPYYSVLVAPPAAGLAGLGAGALWRRRKRLLASASWSAAALVGVTVTGGSAALVLGAYPTLATARWVVMAATATALATVVGLRLLRSEQSTAVGRVLGMLAVVSAVVSCLAGPTAFAASTLGHQVAGANPLAGPLAGSRPQEDYPAPLVSYLAAHRRPDGWLAAAVTSTAASELQLQSQLPVLPLGGFTGRAAGPAVDRVAGWVASGRLRYLVLTGPYYRGLVTPPSLVGTPLAAVMAWAATRGCPVPTGTTRYVVLDLTCRPPSGG